MDRNPPQPGPSLCPLKQGREHRAVPTPGATPPGTEPTRGTGDTPPAPQEQQCPHSTRSGDVHLPSPILCPSPSLLSLPLRLPPDPWVCPSGVWWSRGGLLPPPHTVRGTAGSGWVRRHPSSRSHPAADTPCPLSTKSGSPEGKTGSFPPSKGWGEAALHNRPYRLFPAGGTARLGSALQSPRLPATLRRAGTKPQVHRPVPRGATGSSRPFPGPLGTSRRHRLEKRCPEAGQSRRFRRSRFDAPPGRPSPGGAWGGRCGRARGDLHRSGSPAPPGP